MSFERLSPRHRRRPPRGQRARESFPPIRNAILKGPAYLTVLSFWEVAVKSMKGKLVVHDPRLWISATLNALALAPLLHRPEHVAALFSLPPFHQDPFGRALIAPAVAEDLTLLTTDVLIPKYATLDFRVLK